MNDDPNNLQGEDDDLDAQIAALGLFGDDDDDDFSALEKLNFATDEQEPELMSSDDDVMDLDKQLDLILNADQAADENFEVRDVAVATPTQMVYDPEVEELGVVQYVKGAFVLKEEKVSPGLFSNITIFKMLSTIAIGVLVILVGAVSAIFITLAVREQEEAIAAVSRFVPLELPTDVANNANFVFIHQPMVLNDRTFTLNSISAGYSGTFFYFHEFFDPEDYIILLYNQGRLLYGKSTFDIESAPPSGTVLKFSPLTRGTLFLTLHIQCRTTHEFIAFEYRLLEPPIHSPATYLNHLVYADIDDGFSSIILRNAVLDNTSSQFTFSFNHDPALPGIRHNPNSTAPLVTFSDVFATVNNLNSGASIVYFDDFNITLGTATFGAVLNIETPMEVHFNGLTFYYPNPRINVTPEELYGNNQREPFQIEAGLFTLNLEAMQQQGQFLVLTLHGIDERGFRRETIPSMSLRISVNNGFITIPGVTRSSPRGSDVIFDLAPHINEIRDVHISHYSLVVHSVEFDLPQISVPFQVSQYFDNLPSNRRTMAEITVREAFRGLLAYKSNEVTLDGLVGLSPEIKQNDEVMGIFAPTNLSERPMQAVNVISGDLISNYDYLAVVEVQWVTGFGDGINYFSSIFQVVVRSQDAIWSIVDIREI